MAKLINKKIIFYSHLTLWSMRNKSGAPSFYKTVELYVNKGWEVYCILLDGKNDDSLLDKEHLYSLNSNNIINFLVLCKKIRFINRIFNLLLFFIYNFYALIITKKILNANINAVIYAYEVHTVSIAKYISKIYNMPLVTRFQGTILYNKVNSLFNRFIYFPHFEALATEADITIMTNDGTFGDITLKRLGNKSKKVLFYVNGVDACFDESINVRNENNIKEDDILLVTVSRLVKWKRVDRAINIVKELKQRGLNIKLIIVGTGDQETELKTIVKKYNVNNEIIFTGALKHDAACSYINASDFFLSFYDLSNVGNPLLEALKLGKFVVTLNNGGTSDFIKDKYNGLIFDEFNSKLISDLIIDYWNDKYKYNSIVENSKIFSSKKLYSWIKRMDLEYDEINKLV